MIERLLSEISGWPAGMQFLFFLAENILLSAMALLLGALLLRGQSSPAPKTTPREWRIVAGTVLINTIITHAGFYLYETGLVRIGFGWSWYFFTDLLLLFFAMDFLMFVFHWSIHHSFLYRHIHGLHHEAVAPKPVDLFVLHPVETLGFGSLWLCVLLTGNFNGWAIATYLAVNVVFGIIGHLGVPAGAEGRGVMRYAGMARFHHDHHRNESCNYGFYTNIWDRLFRTYADPRHSFLPPEKKY